MQGAAGSGGGPPGTGSAVLQQQASSLDGTAAQWVAGVVLGRSGAGTPLLGTAPLRSRGGHGAHGPPRRPGGPAPWCSEWERRHGAVSPRDRGRLGRDALPPAKRRRCPPPGLGGEHGAVAPGVLHVQVEGRGRPGEVRRRLAPLGGGAVSREGDATPAGTTRRATGSACGTPGCRGEAGSEDSAQAATQEEPPTSVWQLYQHSVRTAALQRRSGHAASPYFISVPPPVPLTSLCSCHVPAHPRGATPWFRALPGKPGTEATGRCRYPGAVSTVAVGAGPCLRLGADAPVLRRTPLQPHDAPVQNTRWGGLDKGTHTSLGEGWVTGGPGIRPHTATPRWSPPCAIVTSSRWPARGGARSRDLAATAGPGHPQVAC